MTSLRDTSADEMARALAAYARTPEAAESGARERLYSARREIADTVEALLRIATMHGKSQRLSWREREMTREAQQRGITLLAKLADIERIGGVNGAQERVPAGK